MGKAVLWLDLTGADLKQATEVECGQSTVSDGS